MKKIIDEMEKTGLFHTFSANHIFLRAHATTDKKPIYCGFDIKDTIDSGAYGTVFKGYIYNTQLKKSSKYIFHITSINLYLVK